jgi:hypothetical protein
VLAPHASVASEEPEQLIIHPDAVVGWRWQALDGLPDHHGEDVLTPEGVMLHPA